MNPACIPWKDTNYMAFHKHFGTDVTPAFLCSTNRAQCGVMLTHEALRYTVAQTQNKR